MNQIKRFNQCDKIHKIYKEHLSRYFIHARLPIWNVALASAATVFFLFSLYWKSQYNMMNNRAPQWNIKNYIKSKHILIEFNVNEIEYRLTSQPTRRDEI